MGFRPIYQNKRKKAVCEGMGVFGYLFTADYGIIDYERYPDDQIMKCVLLTVSLLNTHYTVLQMIFLFHKFFMGY